MPFLPVRRSEFRAQPDFILITGEAYVDHPSFGHAIISRLIEAEGFSVVIIPQPQKDADYREFGAPKYAFLVSSGVVDSMVNNYTVAKQKRGRDVYSEGGKIGMRPDRATVVYTKALKKLFPSSAVITGGIEPSLRRFAHYDYWSDSVMPTILADAPADLLIYGMGERPLREILSFIRRGVPVEKIKDVRGTAYMSDYDDLSDRLKTEFYKNAVCPSFEEVSSDKMKYVKAFNIQCRNNDYFSGKTVIQRHGKRYLVQNPPAKPLTPVELDKSYAYPYMRDYHPMYEKGVPAVEEVKFSLTSCRGCFGNCNYCALTYHMGRVVQKRTVESILSEARSFVAQPDFKGYIHDLGGPTANFRNTACKKQNSSGVCMEKNCIGYTPCANLEIDHREYLEILRRLREIEGVKKVFIRSGIRFDYLMYDKDKTFFRELVINHISGQLKIAPEHIENKVLEAMNKPRFEVYKSFYDEFYKLTKAEGKEQYLVPYFISSHPECTLGDAVKLAEYLKSINHMPEQVQDFYPTPSTKSTCMYYTGINPDTMREIYVPRTAEEKRMQRALMQWRKPSNYPLVKKALEEAGRTDLIGFKPNCLIKPTKEDIAKEKQEKGKGKRDYRPRQPDSSAKRKK